MSVTIRPLAEADLPAAEQINRSAFGQFFGVDPLQFRLGADVIGPRWRAWPEAGLALELHGTLAAVGLMMDWGSVCILGPITVVPRHWGNGLGRQLVAALMAIVERRQFSFTGLFTHPQSATHIRLYEGFGFLTQRITAVMAKPVAAGAAVVQAARLSLLDGDERTRVIASIRDLTESVFPGLDVSGEIVTVDALNIGETLVLTEHGRPAAMAICHHGPRSEATEGQLLVKFAVAQGGPGAEARFSRLLDQCEQLAGVVGTSRIVAGTNCGRASSYRLMQDRGYRTIMNGIAMIRPDSTGYNVAETFVIDDWR